MISSPKAIIVDGKVVNHEQLKRYYADRRNAIIRRGMFQDLAEQEYPKEVLSYPEPEWNKNQWDFVLQIKAEVQGWRQKHAEMMLELDKKQKPKRKPKYD